MYLIILLLHYLLQKGHLSIPIIQCFAAHVILPLHLFVPLCKLGPVSFEFSYDERHYLVRAASNKAILHSNGTFQSFSQCPVLPL